MAQYEYECPVDGKFSKIQPSHNNHTSEWFINCPECNADSPGIISLVDHRWKHTGKDINGYKHKMDNGRDLFADGEGFKSEVFSTEEANYRIKYSVPRGVSI